MCRMPGIFPAQVEMFAAALEGCDKAEGKKAANAIRIASQPTLSRACLSNCVIFQWYLFDFWCYAKCFH